MAQVTPMLIRKEVIVHTILISDKADQKMIKLATSTGGKAFFDSGSYDSTDLQSAFRSTIIDDDEGAPGITPVEVGSVASERCCIVLYMNTVLKCFFVLYKLVDVSELLTRANSGLAQ